MLKVNSWQQEKFKFDANKLSKIKWHFSNGTKVLDIGCGDCSFGDALKRRFPKIEYAGFDVAKESREIASRKRYKFYKDVGEIKEKFDVICMLDVIEHLDMQTIESYAIHIQRLLKLSGKLVVMTPNIDTCFFVLNRFWDNPEHVRPYSTKSLELIFNRLRLIETAYSSPFVNPHKIFLNFMLFQKYPYQNAIYVFENKL